MTPGAVREAPGPELERVLHALRVRDVRPQLLDATKADARAHCRVLDAKYSPGRSCIVLYAVGLRLVSGEVRLDDADPARAAVPLRLTVFPDDPGLPALRALVNPLEARSLLAGLAPEGAGRVLTGSTELIRYRAGRRATVRLSGRLRDGSGALHELVYVVKLYHDPGKAAAVAAESTRLEQSRPVRCGALAVAPFVGFLPALPAVAWAAVEGVPLDLVLSGRRATVRAGAVLRLAGASLCMLHSAQGVSERDRPIEEELAKYLSRAGRVTAVAPDVGVRLCAVLEGLAARRDVLLGAVEALIHGDCKPSQFLLGDSGVTVLDLDSCRRGDPASDLGGFLATLRQRDVSAALHDGRPLRLARPLAAQFLDGYFAASGAQTGGAALLRRRAAWFEALALQRKAQRAFARAPLSPLPAALIRSAEVVLSELDRGRP